MPDWAPRVALEVAPSRARLALCHCHSPEVTSLLHLEPLSWDGAELRWGEQDQTFDCLKKELGTQHLFVITCL